MDLSLLLQSDYLCRIFPRQELELCNKLVEPYGLSLSSEQMQALVKQQQEALRETERIEFGQGILRELIAAFASSPYLENDTFDGVLADIQTMFYHFKSETKEQISDGVLLDTMRKVFDDKAHGSLEILEGISPEELLKLACENEQDANEDWSETEAYAEKRTSFEPELNSKDELDRVYDNGHYDRPGNFYAGMFYDDHDEIYRIIGDWDSRIGGSSLG